MKPRRAVDRFVHANGLRHHLVEWDGGGSTTVLLLHGFLDLARTWTFMVEALPADFDAQVIALDWRGHGQTDRVGAGGYYHFPDYVRDVDVIARSVRRERLVVVGHSMGAMVSTLWLGARTDAADGLLLVEAIGPFGLDPEARVERMRTWLDQTAPFEPPHKPMRDVAHAAERLRRYHPRLSPSDALRLAEWGTEPDGDAVRWRHDPLHRTRSPNPMPDAAAAAFFRAITCPVRWIGGADSPWNGDRLERWLGVRPDIARRLLPTCAHMVQYDQPDRLANELVDFVSDCQSAH